MTEHSAPEGDNAGLATENEQLEASLKATCDVVNMNAYEIVKLRTENERMRNAITNLSRETVYEGGKMQNGISVAFVQRIYELRDTAGLIPADHPWHAAKITSP